MTISLLSPITGQGNNQSSRSNNSENNTSNSSQSNEDQTSNRTDNSAQTTGRANSRREAEQNITRNKVDNRGLKSEENIEVSKSQKAALAQKTNADIRYELETQPALDSATDGVFQSSRSMDILSLFRIDNELKTPETPFTIVSSAYSTK